MGIVGVGLFRGVALGDIGPIATKAATTTDILGPFYRPGSPLRVNINPADFSGEVLTFSGTIFREDGRTPFKNCVVEVWQCGPDQAYDNTSDEFRFRGSQNTGTSGKYRFMTTQPVPYPAAPGSKVLRPAHIHMRISGEGQQDLVTQVYVAGDPNIDVDPCASNPLSANRIVAVTGDKKNDRSIRFDVVMSKEFKPDDGVFNKLSGLYAMNDNSITEFYRQGDLLVMKWNGQIREELSYKGNNEFAGGFANSAKFDLVEGGDVKVKVLFVTVLKKEFVLNGVKAFKY